MSDVISPSEAEATAAGAHVAKSDDALVHLMPVEAFRRSSTKAQAERRKRFDAAGLQELTESMKQVGVLEPILSRYLPAEDGTTLEIVFGERRWTCAVNAGLRLVPTFIRVLSDEQVLQLQLIENIQREALHGLAEIEAYEELVRRHGYTAERLAQEVGKERAYIVQRLKLLALCAAARQAYSKGKLSEDHALLLARVPVESLQREALKDALEGPSGEPMSVRSFSRLLQTKYMLRLAQAPFPTDDAELVPAAGPCGACPKRTGNQPELFADVQGADVCTDLACFAAKRAAWTARKLAEAKAAGRTVIEGKAAKEIAPAGSHHLEGYVRSTDRCYEDHKNRTYAELLGRSITPSILVVPGTGEVIDVLEKKRIAPLLKERGVGGRTKAGAAEREQRAKTKQESAYRWRLFEAVRAKSPTSLRRPELEQVALTCFQHQGYEARKRILKVWGWTQKDGKAYDVIHHDDAAASRVPKLSDAELARFLLDCVLVSDLQVSAWIKDDKPERLLAAAKKHRIDVGAIRKNEGGATGPQKSLLASKETTGSKRPQKAIRKQSRAVAPAAG